MAYVIPNNGRSSRSNDRETTSSTMMFPSLQAADSQPFSFRSLSAMRQVSLLVGLIGVILLATSLVHLAGGINRITGDGVALSWCLAIGIDLTIVALKLATVVASNRPVWAQIKGITHVTLVISLLLSAGLNILSYVEGKPVTGIEFGACIVLGTFIPFAVWALSRVAACLWVAGGKPVTYDVELE